MASRHPPSCGMFSPPYVLKKKTLFAMTVGMGAQTLYVRPMAGRLRADNDGPGLLDFQTTQFQPTNNFPHDTVDREVRAVDDMSVFRDDERTRAAGRVELIARRDGVREALACAPHGANFRTGINIEFIRCAGKDDTT